MYYGFTLGHTTLYQSQRYINASNNGIIPSYWLSDAILTWQKKIIRYNVQLSLLIRNVFDKAYESVAQYPGIAREFVIGAEITF